MKLKAVLLILVLQITVQCTNPQFDEVNKRVRESLAGNLITPGNIDPSGTNQFTFAVIGDTHVGSPLGTVLDEAMDNIVTNADSFVILTGDLTDNAKNTQFDSLISSLDNRSLTYRAVVGNHDIYFGGWSRYKVKLGSSTYSFDADNVHFAMIDSANGVLGEKQLNWLKADLAATSQPLKVIVTHFSPITGIVQNFWRMASDEEVAILKDICYKNGVQLVLAGHFHGYINKKIGNTLFVTTGAVNKLLEINAKNHIVRVTVNNNNISVQKVKF